MASTYRTQSKQILRQIKADTTASCLATGERILQCTRARIASHAGAKGVALGSGANEADLAASAYIATAKDEGKGYSDAVNRAGGGKTTRFAAATHVGSGPNEFRLKVAFALDRAALMHQGYFDPRAGIQMMGTPFLTDCADSHFAGFKKEMQGNVKALQNIVETRFKKGSDEWYDSLGGEGQDALHESYQQDVLADVDRSIGGDMREDWAAFKGHYGDEMKRQRGELTGRTRKMTRRHAGKTYTYPVLIQTQYWESAMERLDRISEAFIAFRSNQSTADMSYSMANSAERDFVRRAIGSKA